MVLLMTTDDYYYINSSLLSPMVAKAGGDMNSCITTSGDKNDWS